jgi:hypothetical protein
VIGRYCGEDVGREDEEETAQMAVHMMDNMQHFRECFLGGILRIQPRKGCPQCQ